MFRINLKIAIRNLRKYRSHSFINISGLSVGMAVAIVIGLWIYDELSFDNDNSNAQRIAYVWQHGTGDQGPGSIYTGNSVPLHLTDELKNKFGSDFKYIVRSGWNTSHFMQAGDKKVTGRGNYFDGPAPELLDLKMLDGYRGDLKDPSAMLISASIAKSLFGNAGALGKLVRVDDQYDTKISGVYEDFPANSSFAGMNFVAPWKQYEIIAPWITRIDNLWQNNSFQALVQIADHADMASVSKKISQIRTPHLTSQDLRNKPENFLFPMNRWHLYSEWKNGKNTGGAMDYVLLFGTIGVFVLLLACINFMNLSTARSQKRAREVGVRKTIGSVRSQLIAQFYTESLLMSMLSLLFALLIVQLSLPWFNQVADKELSISWSNPFFWMLCLGFSIFTGLVAGSYPAIYLSSFEPVKVLKGTFRIGRLAALPRQTLVVLQFTVSVVLIIGTIVVYRQIQFAKNRPVNYKREGLVMVNLKTMAIHRNFDVLRQDLLNAGVISEMAEAGSPTTAIWSTNDGFSWKGMDPGLNLEFPNTSVTLGYGKTVGWQFTDGRDFSGDYASDSAAFVINEAAARITRLKHPVGETIAWNGVPFHIIGVVKDMVLESPYQQARPNLYRLDPNPTIVLLRLNPGKSVHESMSTIEKTFAVYSPNEPFLFQFADQEYALKFNFDEHVGKLASTFAGLAIFISCLGLFGMASYMAEQRIKEIGVRKVLGASVTNLWALLSSGFVKLVFIALLIAVPIAWYFMHQWLLQYAYRSTMDAWIFLATAAGAMGITLLTVSYQTIKAAMANPVVSLKSE